MYILGAVISAVVILIVLFVSFPILWPLATSASGNVTAMEGTDAGTVTFKGFVPVALLVVGLGAAVALIMFVLKQFQILT